jgi:hypothetical protein
VEVRFNKQREFTSKVLAAQGLALPLKEEDKIAWTKEYLLCIVSECMEVLREIDWKHHRKEDKIPNINNLGIELIDIQKFLWGLCSIWDIDYDKFKELYDIKTVEVESLWVQNHVIPEIPESQAVCIIDIDGVLNYYPKCFHDWVKNQFGKEVDKVCNPVEYVKYKGLYRDSGAKKDLPINENSKEALQKLKLLGYTIVLLTNRPYKLYKRIYSDTITWLNSNNISYDFIFWAPEEKITAIWDKCPKIKFIVDDNPNTCYDFAAMGVKTYCFNGKNDDEDVINITNLKEIDELK